MGTVIGTNVGLGVLGFTPAGVVAGSAAATIQSVVYGGATSGVFSACQAAGVVGLGSAAIPP